MIPRRLLLLLCALVLLALLLIELRLPFSLMLGVVEDAAHGPLFALIAWITLSLLRGSRSPALRLPAAQYFGAAAICFTLGLATELAQAPGPRDASFSDFVNDVLGTVGGLALYALFDRRVAREPRALRIGFATVAIGAFLVFAVPVVWAIGAYVHRNEQFPVLIDGASRFDLFFIARLGTSVTRAAGGALRIEFRDEPWPGITLIEPKRNWTGYATLVVDVENPNEAPLPLGIHVRDRFHTWEYRDRFNREFQLAARERRTLRFPLERVASAPRGRRMEMRRIAGLALFRTSPDAPQVLLLHSIRLE